MSTSCRKIDNVSQAQPLHWDEKVISCDSEREKHEMDNKRIHCTIIIIIPGDIVLITKNYN